MNTKEISCLENPADVGRVVQYKIIVFKCILDRQWMYQMCSELGIFATSSLSTDLYGQNIPIDFYENLCIGIFGKL